MQLRDLKDPRIRPKKAGRSCSDAVQCFCAVGARPSESAFPNRQDPPAEVSQFADDLRITARILLQLRFPP
jgi:hypothetical protein